VRLLPELAKIHATFDDPNLESQAGLVPVVALAQRSGLAALVDEACPDRPPVQARPDCAARAALTRAGHG
jgi:hypothetical protein